MREVLPNGREFIILSWAPPQGFIPEALEISPKLAIIKILIL